MKKSNYQEGSPAALLRKLIERALAPDPKRIYLTRTVSDATRRYTWIPRLDWMERPMRSQRKKLAGVGLVERRREIAGKVSIERSFYIGSQGIDSAQ